MFIVSEPPPCLVITALHGIRTQSSDENSVCPSHACIVTKRKKDLSTVQIFIPYETSLSLVF